MVAAEILQQEAADAGLGNVRLELGTGRFAVGEAREVDGAHSADERLEIADLRRRDRRHIDDTETLDQRWVSQRQRHGDLAAHRVTDHGVRLAVALRLEQLGDLIGHLRIGEVVGPGRTAVVGQVDQRDSGLVAERLGDGRPVLALAEQAVQEDDARPGAPGLGAEQLARGGASWLVAASSSCASAGARPDRIRTTGRAGRARPPGAASPAGSAGCSPGSDRPWRPPHPECS